MKRKKIPNWLQQAHWRSLITDHCNENNNNGKNKPVARITKMWHRGTNWTNAISSILSNLKSSMNVQQYYLKNQCTYLNFKTEKTKTIQTKKKWFQ